jgi:hypothetical protein
LIFSPIDGLKEGQSVSGLLLDTRLFKHLAPGGGGRRARFRDWVANSQEPIFLSIVSIVDINAKIQKVRDTRQSARAAALDSWLESGLDADRRQQDRPRLPRRSMAIRPLIARPKRLSANIPREINARSVVRLPQQFD